MNVLKKTMAVFIVSFFAVNTVSAATLYMDPTSLELDTGDIRNISLRMNVADEECINAIDATINFPEGLEIIDFSRGQSILSLWIEEPVVDKANNTITFAGGIPNGYCGRVDGDPRVTNNILDLVVMAPGLMIGSSNTVGTFKVEYGENTRVLLNDGFGTEAGRTMFGTDIKFTGEKGTQQSNEWLDVIALDDGTPEDFQILLTRQETTYSNDWFISFNTTDKLSGMSHYEVMEEPLEQNYLFNWGAADAPWKRVTSPYSLEDQSLNSTIRVKAIDKAGNEYIAVLVPDEALRGAKLNTDFIILALGGLFSVGALAVIVYFVRKLMIKRRERKLEEDDEEEYEEYEEYDEEEGDGEEDDDEEYEYVEVDEDDEEYEEIK